ncbi:MAG TPA: hypothetical protein VFZ58_03330 [Candidatus Saccharimonadales bacterium]
MLASGMDEAEILELCQQFEKELEESSMAESLALTPVDLSEFAPATRKILTSWQLTTLGELQMLSTTELSWIEGFGRARRERLRHYLEAQEPPLRFRDRRESFLERADTVYGGLDRVPASLLALVALQLSEISEAEAWLAALETQEWLTIGDLREVTAGRLRHCLPDFSYGSRESRVDVLIDWLRKHGVLSSLCFWRQAK